MASITLRDDGYIYTDALLLPADHPRAELERLASDLAVYDRARAGGQRDAPDSVPDEHLDVWWRGQVLAAHLAGAVVALRAQPLRQAWAPLWGAALVRLDDMQRGRAVLVGLRVLGDEALIASWSSKRDPAQVLRELAEQWCVERELALGRIVETTELQPVTRRAWVSIGRVTPQNSGGPGEE